MVASMEATIFNCQCDQMQNCKGGCETIYDAGLWGVVNNAGIMGSNGPPEWHTIDNYKATNAVNLYGLIDVTMTFLPLVKMARGRVVNTSSEAGRFSMPFITPYSVSKYGVEAFTDGLRSVAINITQNYMVNSLIA